MPMLRSALLAGARLVTGGLREMRSRGNLRARAVVCGFTATTVGVTVGVSSVLCDDWNYDWDERGNETRGSGSRVIYLVRHGHYITDKKSEMYGHLTDKGKKQAAETGKRLAKLPVNFDRIVVSSMPRAQETAAAIVPQLSTSSKPETDALLAEGWPYRVSPDPLQKFTDREVTPRIDDAFEKYFHRAPSDQTKDTHELFVCHGNVIRYFVCRALQFPKEGWLRMSVAHGSITVLTLRPTGTVSLTALGNSGFMEPGIISFS